MFVVLTGIGCFMPFSVFVVMGQDYLPNRIGTASGVTVGLAVTIGGLFSPVFGRIADSMGLRFTLDLHPFCRFCTAAVPAHERARVASPKVEGCIANGQRIRFRRITPPFEINGVRIPHITDSVILSQTEGGEGGF